MPRHVLLAVVAILLTAIGGPASRAQSPPAVTQAAAAPAPATAVQAPVFTRAPMAEIPRALLPVGSIRPRGWLKRQLEIQATGLTGHLHEIWPDVGPTSGWLGGDGESWERGPYFLDGLVPLAWLLDDARLKETAKKFIDWTLDHQQPDGWIGPRKNTDWWPNFVILKVLTQYHEVTGDPRVIPPSRSTSRTTSRPAGRSRSSSGPCSAGPTSSSRSCGSTTAPATRRCSSSRRCSTRRAPTGRSGTRSSPSRRR